MILLQGLRRPLGAAEKREEVLRRDWVGVVAKPLMQLYECHQRTVFEITWPPEQWHVEASQASYVASAKTQ